MITITEIQPHYITGKLKLIKGYTVFYKYEIKNTRLNGSTFIESEKTLIDLNAMKVQIKTEINSQ